MYIDMLATLHDKRPSFSTVKNWVSRFRMGYLSTEEEKCCGRPTKVTIPGNVDASHATILDVQIITSKKLADTLVIF
jgi:transposase